jgi:hypothetical protein
MFFPMFTKWLPWKYLLRRAARKHGFIDPVQVLGWLRRFAEPSEVSEPIELLRAGVVFHARGAVNSRAIQHNLDWVWPYWVERQFDPRDPSFVPRAFSLTHINLTHRNWTAVGLPDCWALPIVDPAGLVTPLYDGWSLDAWVIPERGARLCPSEVKLPRQRLLPGNPAVETEVEAQGLRLLTRSEMVLDDGHPLCRFTVEAQSEGREESAAWIAVVVRPYNPEGISFVHSIDFDLATRTWLVNGRDRVTLDTPPDRHAMANYRQGDVLLKLPRETTARSIRCDVGLASAAALYALEPGATRRIQVQTGLAADLKEVSFAAPAGRRQEQLWGAALESHTRLEIPDAKMQFLYDAAVRTLVLHSPLTAPGRGDVFPGPYTYKRFWFRDAAFILHALLCVNLPQRVLRVLACYPERQNSAGYYHSQEGEWDSNGEALWILMRYCQLTGTTPPQHWQKMIEKGARWIQKKRRASSSMERHPGLLPPGFSAEHLGHIDYYYWDNYWGVAGLRAAAWLAQAGGETSAALGFGMEADKYMADINRSIEKANLRLRRLAIPAAPDRRLDAGAIGSLAGAYPLQLCPPDDPHVLDTVRFLLEQCSLDNGFFQEMIHSGINPYLTLHMAQALLRADDPRYLDLLQRVAELATATGQWPEAIHPTTMGGCMGDGQHVWAAAEWVLMLRNCFVREEGDELVLGAGLPAEWLAPPKGEGETSPLRLGPAPTTFGSVQIEIIPGATGVKFDVTGRWYAGAPPLKLRLAGFEPLRLAPGQTHVELARCAAEPASHAIRPEASNTP